MQDGVNKMYDTKWAASVFMWRDWVSSHSIRKIKYIGKRSVEGGISSGTSGRVSVEGFFVIWALMKARVV